MYWNHAITTSRERLYMSRFYARAIVTKMFIFCFRKRRKLKSSDSPNPIYFQVVLLARNRFLVGGVLSINLALIVGGLLIGLFCTKPTTKLARILTTGVTALGSCAIAGVIFTWIYEYWNYDRRFGKSPFDFFMSLSNREHLIPNASTPNSNFCMRLIIHSCQNSFRF